MGIKKFIPINSKEFDHNTLNIDVIYSTENAKTTICEYGLVFDDFKKVFGNKTDKK